MLTGASQGQVPATKVMVESNFNRADFPTVASFMSICAGFPRKRLYFTRGIIVAIRPRFITKQLRRPGGRA